MSALPIFAMNLPVMNISFENTEKAFAYKSDKDLKLARFLFKTMGSQWLVNFGVSLTPLALKLKLPIDGLVRKTIFKQFVGGETLQDTSEICKKLAAYNVDVILDYGVEGKEGEQNFDLATQEFIRVINYASAQPGIHFISVKVTGIARNGLLEKLNDAPRLRSGVHDNEAEDAEWERVRERMYRICEAAAEKNIGVLIDAEETWIQDPIDRLTIEMMEAFNEEKAVVYNTIQLYRHDRLHFLQLSYNIARQNNFVLGVKLVRGAYMEKERERASARGEQSPIQPDKASTDKDFNEAVRFCLDNIENISAIVATHNEESTMLTIAEMQSRGLPADHPNVHFSQLYGMSDNITFNLAEAGYSVSKYLPFGPINDVVPYLMRRARENSSVSGQTGRELVLINKEIKRRKGK
jgi:proline dehydrogenase